MRRICIDHLTEYEFATAVTLLPHRLMLRPRENHIVRIISFALDIFPAHAIKYQRDMLDNSVALATFSESAKRLSITSRVVIEHYEETPLDFLVEERALRYPFEYLASEAPELAPFRITTWPEDRWVLQGWLERQQLVQQGAETFALVDRLNRAIFGGFRHQSREEPGVQSPARTISRNEGSCRDVAALFVEACRHLGLASRFISGYVNTKTSEVDAGATHAWAEVYLPGPGWTGFDPSCGEVTGARHIAVAVARHPEAVPPVAGSFLGSQDARPNMRVRVDVCEQPAWSASVRPGDSGQR
jgi:transglutaminase-like putative cysteine protease